MENNDLKEYVINWLDEHEESHNDDESCFVALLMDVEKSTLTEKPTRSKLLKLYNSEKGERE